MAAKRKDIDINLVIEQYRLGKSAEYIANYLGCHAFTVRKRLRDHGEEIRGKNGRYGNPYTVNSDFFRIWNHDMAYIAGYIVADGCVRPNKYELAIKSIDYDLLEYVRSTMLSTYPIVKLKNTNCFQLSLYSKKIVDSLLQLGIGPRKSLTVRMPKMPHKYFWSFLRGLVDGDGHVTPVIPNSPQIRLQINGNTLILNEILEVLGDVVGCPQYALNPQGKSAAVGIYGKTAYKCLKHLYQNNMWALPRKRNAAIAAIKQFEVQRHRNCQKCGIDLELIHHNRKFCHNCSEERARECRLRYEAKLRQIQ